MKKIIAGVLTVLLLSVSFEVPTYADCQKIVIDGCSYDMDSFSARVIECTETKVTTKELLSLDGQKVSFTYDDYNRRILKESEKYSVKYEI